MPVANGKQISSYLMDAGLSPDRLATLAGLSLATVKRARASRNVSRRSLDRLASAFSGELNREVTASEISSTSNLKHDFLPAAVSKKLTELSVAARGSVKILGVSAEAVEGMIAGKSIRRSDAEKISAALGIDIDQVIRGHLEPPPNVPAQTSSAHFTISDGLISTIPTQNIGPDENDYRRLAALQNPLLSASRNSRDQLSKDNKPFAALLDVMVCYLEELDKDVHEINYAVLYSYGLQLAAAYETAEDLIAKGELPEFNIDSLTSIRSVIHLHGPFILSSKDGRDLVTDAERYKRTPVEERRFQADVQEFGEILRARDDLVESKTGEFISSITAPDDGTEHFERRYLFTKGATKNLVIVFSAGAVVASSSFIPIVGPVVAASLGLLTVEAMKKSKPFNDLSAPIRRSLDDLSNADLARLREIPSEQLKKMREFVVSNQDILRRVGGSAREMQWFRDVLDWVKSPDDQLKLQETLNHKKSPHTEHAHLLLLIDDSSSMSGRSSGEFYHPVNNAISELLTSYRRAELSSRLSIVTFGSSARIIVDEKIENEIEFKDVGTLGRGGSTNLAAALILAENLLAENESRNLPPYIVIISDGYPDDPQTALKVADRIKSLGVGQLEHPRVVTVSLSSASEGFLEKLASKDSFEKFSMQVGDLSRLIPGVAKAICSSSKVIEVDGKIGHL